MSLALEEMAKLAILLVVVAVVIGFMISYFGTLNKPDIFDQNSIPPGTEKKEGTFDASALAGWIKSCWLKVQNARNDLICSVLLGSFTAKSNDEIKSLLPASMKDRVVFEADYSKSAVIIEYVYRDNTVHVKS